LDRREYERRLEADLPGREIKCSSSCTNKADD
jgi:hypothetical protein